MICTAVAICGEHEMMEGIKMKLLSLWNEIPIFESAILLILTIITGMILV
jgi:hypothetical protein